MESMASPDAAQMEIVMRAVWEACRRHRVPVGMAPNVEVSLIVNPDDAAELIEHPGLGDLAWRATLATLRVVAKPIFRRRMRARAPRAVAAK